MKRMLYLGNVNLLDNNSGVSKKVKNQVSFFEKNNIEVSLPNIYKNGNVNKFLGRIPFIPRSFVTESKKYLSNINIFDYLYIRKPLIDFWFIRMLKEIRLKNPEITILMEIPTYPYDQEFNSLLDVSYLIKEKSNRWKLKNYIDRIVTFSDDDKIFGIPTICISNGIDTTKITPVKGFDNTKQTIELIAVASMSFWHGYDRVLLGMASYYESGGDKKILLHLVGEGEEIKKYKEIVSKNNLEKYVIFHGKKSGEELDEIYDQADIALDSMGRHRAGISYNSTLKGKEYGAKGLPIISGVKTELDKDQAFKYYMRVSPNDEPINMFSVIDFYNKIYNSGESRTEIVKYINSYTKKHFDIDVTWKPILDYLNE